MAEVLLSEDVWKNLDKSEIYRTSLQFSGSKSTGMRSSLVSLAREYSRYMPQAKANADRISIPGLKPNRELELR